MTGEPLAARPPTIADVAREAGVSTATVSYVLNGRHTDRIPAATRERVRAAASALRYVPQGTARSLRRGRSDLVLAHVGPEVPSRPLARAHLVQLTRDCAEAGYTLLVQGDPGLGGEQAARMWAALRPAAVVAMAAVYTAPVVELLRTSGVTMIALGPCPSADVISLTFDDGPVGELAAEYLVGRDRRDLAALVWRDPELESLGRSRLEAFRAATAARGIAVREVPAPESLADARVVVRSWLAPGGRGLPDGVFGGSDRHAAFLLSALLEAGVRVPDDVALIGAEDDPLCEMLRPRLTSIGIDVSVPESRLAGPVLAALRGDRDEARATRTWRPELRLRET